MEMEAWKRKSPMVFRQKRMRKKALDGGRREFLLLWSKGRCYAK
jgi:hypothetical protein